MALGFDTGTEPPRKRRSGSVGEQYFHALVAELAERFARPDIGPRVEDQLGTPEEAAERVFAGVPQKSPWDRIIGPIYTTPQLQQLLGCSRQALRDRSRRHTLLALRTQDGHLVYPSFQFDGTKVHPGLADVLQVTADVVDEWTIASWLRAPQTGLGDQSVIDVVARYGATEEVLDAARSAVLHWTH